MSAHRSRKPTEQEAELALGAVIAAGHAVILETPSGKLSVRPVTTPRDEVLYVDSPSGRIYYTDAASAAADLLNVVSPAYLYAQATAALDSDENPTLGIDLEGHHNIDVEQALFAGMKAMVNRYGYRQVCGAFVLAVLQPFAAIAEGTRNQAAKLDAEAVEHALVELVRRRMER
jgi:hypothetical protein